MEAMHNMSAEIRNTRTGFKSSAGFKKWSCKENEHDKGTMRGTTSFSLIIQCSRVNRTLITLSHESEIGIPIPDYALLQKRIMCGN